MRVLSRAGSVLCLHPTHNNDGGCVGVHVERAASVMKSYDKFFSLSGGSLTTPEDR